MDIEEIQSDRAVDLQAENKRLKKELSHEIDMNAQGRAKELDPYYEQKRKSSEEQTLLLIWATQQEKQNGTARTWS